MSQTHFRLKLPEATKPALSKRDRTFEERLINLNIDVPRHVPAGKLLADLLKRQIRRIVTDITECPPDTLPAHLARLSDWCDLVEHLCCHDFHGSPEARLSGKQLVCPSTFKDWLAVAHLTRKDHRAPAFVNSRDEALDRLNHKMDLLAGLVAQFLNVPTPEVFTNVQGEEERA